MTEILLIHVGDFRESYYREAESEFLKRLRGYCRFRTSAFRTKPARPRFPPR